MMCDGEVEHAAERLFEAERTRRQIPLLSGEFPDAGMDDAYRVQAALVRRMREAGRRPVGWKIGLTSRAMQSALGIDIPDSGVLFEDMVFAHDAIVPPDRFIRPRVEAEIAFIMKEPLVGRVTIDDVLAATEHVTPSLEILDTRIERVDAASGRTRTIFDTIADNAANAGLVLSERRIAPSAVDMRWIGAIVTRNGSVEETGLGAGVLDHPAAGIAWLAERLQTYGLGIAAGDIVLSGSFVRAVEAAPGDTITGDFGPWGDLRIHFAAGGA